MANLGAMRRLPLEEVHRARGARLGEAEGALVPLAYGDPLAEAAAARRGAVLCDRSQRTRLVVTGSDRVEFLHGQTTSDVRALRPGEGQRTAVLTGKGKVRGEGVLYAFPDALRLHTWGEAASPLVAHLEGFVVMEDVRIADESETTVELGVHGPGAEEAVRAALGDALPRGLPLHRHAAIPFAAGAVTAAAERPTGEEGIEIVAPAELARPLFARLAEHLPLAGWEALELLRIEAGVPRMGREIDADTIPIEARLEEAVDLAKGCFTGQEVLARIRTYGHVNRLLVGLRLEAKEAVPVPAEVHLGERRVGRATSSALSPRAGGPVALAMLRREAAEPGTEVEVEAGGARVPARVVALPFAPAAGGGSR